MTRRERLMATLAGKAVDRPAVNFYEIGGFDIDGTNPDLFNIYNSPSWQPLLKLAEEQTDVIRLRPPLIRAADEKCRSEFLKSETYIDRGSRFTRISINVGGKKLTSLLRRDRDLDTIWTLEHLLKDTDDLKAYMELPDEFFDEQIDVSNLIADDKKTGDKGIVMVDTQDPLCAAAELFSMENFTVIAFTQQKLFHKLIEKMSRHIYARTQKVSQNFPDHLWRIYGAEYAVEPNLPPKLFEEYEVRYTRPMVEMIKKHGGFARIHSHGRISEVLSYILDMGADAIDPIEPPLQGNVELRDVRRKYGRDIVLFGNIEITDIENTEPSEFKKIVRKSLEDGTSGKGRGFVLMPSSSPYGREISATTMVNYETMVELTQNFKF